MSESVAVLLRGPFHGDPVEEKFGVLELNNYQISKLLAAFPSSLWLLNPLCSAAKNMALSWGKRKTQLGQVLRLVSLRPSLRRAAAHFGLYPDFLRQSSSRDMESEWRNRVFKTLGRL